MAGTDKECLDTHKNAPRLIGSKTGSFAYLTIRDRMPVIMTQIVDTLHQAVSELNSEEYKNKIEEGKCLIGNLSEVRHQLMTDKDLGFLEHGDGLEEWRQLYVQLANKRNVMPSWYNVPWLYVECYMYRKVIDILIGSEYFKKYDPFRIQKEKGFQSSLPAMETLSMYLIEKINDFKLEIKTDLREDFLKFLQFCLWGNKTDLSLIAKYDGSQDLSQLQASSKDHLTNLRSKILCDDTELAWTLINKEKGVKRRITYVLDNSGFELFTDLCFADWLITSNSATEVHFEIKNIPWFVSDVTPNDLHWTLEQLKSSPNKNLNLLADRWLGNFADKIWTYGCHPFWTLAHQFSTMQVTSPDLYTSLASGYLVILKGDLNYRKLLGDRDWSYTTPFKRALEGFSPTNLLALRTLKADLVCGITQETADRAAKESDRWMVNGEYAVIQISIV
ncbi:Protein-glutamate O-methyltransferase-like [Oopsacas minuta]|uniref:Sugar phosphate phosphatase n=1 Tax=Oopsacas minuta TaxID=111878 RepID=A0AAV7K734_9METZ|nr:Protein-glutamate O-methyltransferase-like [Oopsacas minuta]